MKTKTKQKDQMVEIIPPSGQKIIKKYPKEASPFLLDTHNDKWK